MVTCCVISLFWASLAVTVEELGADYHRGCKVLLDDEWNMEVGAAELESKNDHAEELKWTAVCIS